MSPLLGRVRFSYYTLHCLETILFVYFCIATSHWIMDTLDNTCLCFIIISRHREAWPVLCLCSLHSGLLGEWMDGFWPRFNTGHSDGNFQNTMKNHQLWELEKDTSILQRRRRLKSYQNYITNGQTGKRCWLSFIHATWLVFGEALAFGGPCHMTRPQWIQCTELIPNLPLLLLHMATWIITKSL